MRLPRLGPFATLGGSAHRNDTSPLSLRGTLVPKQSRPGIARFAMIGRKQAQGERR